jgi:acetoin utilization protein AcuB
MLVQDRMSRPVITVTPETPFQEALKLMQAKKIRRLPVVNPAGHLVGIVSERDLLHASPSPATSLSVWELNYLLWRLTVGDIMAEKVVTVNPATPIVEAARLMVEKKIGGLPVVNESNRVVGIITETDIFKAFVERMSGS